MTNTVNRIRSSAIPAMTAGILVAIIGLFGSGGLPPVSAQTETGICSRTQQVQDAILAKLDNVSDCAGVTASDLSGIAGILSVRGNEAITLKSGDFAGLGNLKRLFLYQDQLTSLPADVFDGLGSLEDLWLSNNQFSELPEDVFDGLGSLESLRLDGNQISALPEDVFDGLENLELLDLDNNQISALPEDVFDGLSSLQWLGLVGNELTTLPEDMFDGLDSLELLNLKNNQINALPEDVFDGLDSLEELFLGINQISALPEDVFDGLGSLEGLGLGPNQISVLPEDVFDDLNSLRSLGLSRNQISVWPEDVFDGLDSLIFLNLVSNQLSELPDDAFTGLDSLTQLLISNNQIARLPEGVFDGLSQLNRLELNSNQLSELPEGAFDGLGSLQQLFLSGNPGAPFTFTAVLEQRGDNVIVVKVAQGAPVSMPVSLSAAGGNLSDDTVTVAAGNLESDAITVTATGGGEVTVSVESAEFVEFSPINIKGIRTGVGNNLTLQSWLAVSGITTTDYVENGTTPVATYAVADAEDSTITWSLSGDDSGDFSISSAGVLSFSTSPNYEDPTDADADNEYEITVNASDGTNDASLHVTVAVINVLHDADELPVITGTAQVGETLTADTSGIADDDGLTNVSYSYQWVANDGSSDTDITDAADSTYTLVAADDGKTIKVRVSFTDDADNGETLTSTATEAVSFAVQPQIANNPATGAPTISGTARAGRTLTVDTSNISDGDGMVNVIFGYQWISNDGTTDTDITDETSSTYTIKPWDLGKYIKARVSFTDDAGNEETLTSSGTTTVAASPDQAPTGGPIISRMAEVGQSLYAVVMGIRDGNGMTYATFSYQWIRNDGTTDSDIPGATGTSYTLTDADEGKTIKVRVSFTDDGANAETLTSYATTAVTARPSPSELSAPTALSANWSRGEEKGIALEWEAPEGTVTSYQILRIEEPTDYWSWSEPLPRPYGCTALMEVHINDTGSDATTYTDTDVAEGASYTYSVRGLNSDGVGLKSSSSERLQYRPPHGYYSNGVPTGSYWPNGIPGSPQAPPNLDSTRINNGIGLTWDAPERFEVTGYQILRRLPEQCEFGYRVYVENTNSTVTRWADRDVVAGTLYEYHVRGINDVGVGDLERENSTSFRPATLVAGPEPNSPATGVPTITGTAQIGETLTADPSGIADVDGLYWARFEYQWLADDTEIDGATSSTYTLQASEAGKVIKVRVTFTDDAGYEESPTSAATGAVVSNVPATGAPAITGTAEVGETLTADTSGIVDSDGLDNVSFSHQWIRSDGTTDWDIDGATGATYGIIATDVDKTIKLQVNFTDDAGNVESLTSSATVTVPIEVAFTFSIEGTTVTCDYWNVHLVGIPIEECDDPSSIEQGTNGEIEVEIEIARSVSSQLYKFDFYIYQVADSLGHYMGRSTFEANDLCLGPGLADSASIEVTANDGTGPFTYTDEGTIFELCPAGTYQLGVPWYRYNYTDQEYELAGQIIRYFFITSTDEGDTSIEQVKWITALYPDPRVSHDDVQIEATKESEVLNRELATFSLSIGGLVPDSDPETTDYVVRLRVLSNEGREWPLCHVGNVGFSYLLKTVPEDGEWAMEAHVPGNCHLDPWSDTSNPWYVYRVADTLQIELFNGSYEFIAGKDIALGALPNSPATGAPTISGAAQVGETLTADTSGIADDDGLTNVSYSYQWIANDGISDTDITDATGSTYTLASADDGKTIKVRVSFTDDAANEETLTSTATEVVSFAVQQQTANNPATGAPTISGTAQVGETLTADTAGIADADGLTNVSYSYQWIANDGISDTDITDATGSTYTLASADEGKTIKVRVSFTDDRGNDESLTSTATSSVAARPNSAATGAPTISGTVQAGETLTADTSGIADDDGLTNVSYSYQWIRNDGTSDTDIEDATESSYTLKAADEGRTIKAQVTFTDDAGNGETLTSTATEAVSFAVQQQTANSPATGTPTISGTALVGETLTADTSGIADADGLDDATFSYQWIANDGTSDADISGAPGPTYALTNADEGQTIKVNVSFTDDAGNEESLTSAATAAVADANTAATGAPTISGTAQVGEMLTVDTSGIADTDGLTNVTFSYQWLSSSGTEIDDATSSTYTLAAADEGRTIRVTVSFTDDVGNGETLTSGSTASVSAKLNQGSAPEAPDQPIGTAVFVGGVDLEWNDVPRADSYDVQLYRNGQWLDLPGDGVEIAFYGAGAIISGLDPNSTLWFQVRARNAHGFSNWSNFSSMASTNQFKLGRRARPDNVPAGGAPVINGTAQVGESLTADTTGIEDGNGLDRVQFRFQWVSHDGSSDTDIASATDSTYTLAASDEGKTIKVRVAFTDRGGYAESLTSAATATVAAAPNSPATGLPAITGTVQVGETLTADTTGIADADGLSGATFTYQWVANGGTSDTDITDATDSTYTLVAADEGKTIKMRVSFTDDAGNVETLTSTATSSVAARPNRAATGAPMISGTAHVGETLSADMSGIGDADGLTNVSYSYQWIRNDGSLDTDITDAADSSYTLVAADDGKTIKVRVSFTDDAGNDESLNSAATATIAATPNSPATGAPAVTGTAQVGETLTADTSGIADTDGLTNVAYNYQWIANDGTADTDIQNATGPTYTLVADDDGKTIKVNVSFADDAGGEETLTSTATEAVSFAVLQQLANNPATGAPTISGTAQVGETLTADTSGIADEDGLDNATFSYQWLSSRDTAISGATGSTHTLVSTDLGKIIKVKVTFTDDEGNEESLTSSPTASVADSSNNPATGSPAISGTGEVGETLTASTSGIADDDGLTNVSYTYQWIANDGISDSDIQDATLSTYTLVSDDVGKTIKVKVSFTDDAENEETLTSAATDSVVTAPASNSPATGAPSITGTAQVGETLIASTTGISDTDGLTNVSYAYQWLTSRDAEIDGATSSTYTLVESDEGKTIKVRVSFTDDAGNEETLTSAATGSVAASNRPASGAPTITGTAQVSETLTASTTGIADTDGLPNVSYSYQWIRNDSTGDTDISGATSSTYTLVDADQGNTVKVRVSFADDAGNTETLTSLPTEPVEPTATESSDPDATRAGAIDLGDITTLAKARYPTYDINGVDDVVDYFMFTITEPKGVQIGIRQLDADATLTLEHEDGTVIGHKSKPGEEHVAMYPTLLEGAYYVRVEAAEEGFNEYRMAHGVNEPKPDRVAELREKATPSNGATGAPMISGTAQVGETLTSDTTGIADEDGLENATFSYQWISNDETKDADIQGATGTAYTLAAADQGKTIKVRVTFTDDADNEETLTSAPTATVAGRPNQPATGAPAIGGMAQVGETLTVDTSGIADDDGLTNVTYSYQWIASDGAVDIDITSATVSSYTLVDADEGQTIQVQVSFTDDAGNEETLTSTATAEVAAGAPTDPPGKPRNLTGTANSDGTVTLRWDAPNDDSVTGYQILRRRPREREKTLLVHVNDTGSIATEYTDNDVTPDVLHAYRVKAINAVGLSGQSDFVSVTPTQPAGPAQNNPATGTPTISGTAQVGETLTADTSGIGDDDGLANVTFSYQWITSDGAVDIDITSATVSSYTPVDADEGQTIQVQVSFTDDAGNDESLTSAATATVAAVPNNPATGTPTISGTAQVGETLTADTSDIADTDGLTNVTYNYQWLGDDTGIAGATSSTYTLAETYEGKTIKVRVSFTDDRGNSETGTSAATAVVAAPEPPAKPTGLSAAVSHDTVTLTWDDPQDDTITGYVILRRDREIHPVGTFVTLTGDTGSADTTYTDDTVEPDKQYVYRIKAINEHGEVSEISDWVRADTPAAPVPDKPTGLSAVVSHDTVTLTWDDPQDDTITGYVILRRDREIHPVGTFVTLTGDTGSADTTYTDDMVEPDKQYVYRIKAINEHGEVSEISDWVRADTPAAPSPAG